MTATAPTEVVPAATLAQHWAALATASLLGTDRRRPPALPPGPLDDLLAAAAVADDAEATLNQVVALTAVRRAGLRPAPPVAVLQAPAADTRPACPAAAVGRLPELLQHWPMLVVEWLQLLDRGGFQLPREHLVALLQRERTDPMARALVERVAGPVAAWLIELFPELAERARAGPAPAEDPAAIVGLPADLAALVASPADGFVAGLVEGLTLGTLANRHRPLLVRVVCQAPPHLLAPLAEALASASPRAETIGLADTLAELARARHEMIAELVAGPARVTEAAFAAGPALVAEESPADTKDGP